MEKKKDWASFERCSRKKIFFWLAAGRSGAEQNPAANQKKKFFSTKKRKFFSRRTFKTCSILFFFQAFRDNMFLLFECFLEKIMPFLKFRTIGQNFVFLFLHLVFLLIVSFFVNEYFWFGQNLVFYFSPLSFFVAFLSFFSNRYFSFGQNFVFCFSPFSFFVAFLSLFSNRYLSFGQDFVFCFSPFSFFVDFVFFSNGYFWFCQNLVFLLPFCHFFPTSIFCSDCWCANSVMSPKTINEWAKLLKM